MRRIIHCIESDTYTLDGNISACAIQRARAMTMHHLRDGHVLEHNGYIIAANGDDFVILGEKSERSYENAWDATNAWMNIHAYTG